MLWLIVAISSFAAGLAQTVVGFGAGMILMMVLPYFMSIIVAPTVTSSVCLCLSATLAWKGRKEINFKILFVPAIIYLVVNVAVINYLDNFNTGKLAILFGVFLTLLGLYLLLFSEKIHLEPSPILGAVFGFISGLCSGLFGLSGPLMTVYFLPASKTHSEYIATTQFLFAIVNFVNLVSRLYVGLSVPHLFPLVFLGLIGIMSGMHRGKIIEKRLCPQHLKLIIYYSIILSGIVQVLQHL